MSRVRDTLDLSLHDDLLYEEIELMLRLMVAANESDRRLSQDEIDAQLGLSRSRRLPRQARRGGDG